MTAARTLLLATALALPWPGAALAWPTVPSRPPASIDAAEPTALVCGPYRCFRRPFWRYGYGTGFRPFLPYAGRGFRRFEFRRFGYPPFGLGFRRG